MNEMMKMCGVPVCTPVRTCIFFEKYLLSTCTTYSGTRATSICSTTINIIHVVQVVVPYRTGYPGGNLKKRTHIKMEWTCGRTCSPSLLSPHLHSCVR